MQGHVTIDGIRGDAADVVVVLPDDVDITFFRNEFVRVQGVASVVSDAPVLVLREGDEVVGDLVACHSPPVLSSTRKLAQAGAL